MALSPLHGRSAHKARLIAAAGVAGAAVLGAPMAWAAVTADQDQVSTCVASSGLLRVIDASVGEQCRKNEVPLTFATGAGSGSLADGSVVGGAGGVVADGTIDNHDLKNGSVTADDLGFGEVGSGHLKNLSVQDEDIDSGAIGSRHIADGAIESSHIQENSLSESDLRPDLGDLLLGLPTRLAELELLGPEVDSLRSDLADVEGRLDALGDPGAADVVHTKNLYGLSTHEIASSETPPVPAGSSSEVQLPVPGVTPGDLITVSPPATLPAGLAFGGARISGPDTVTVVLANYSGAASSGVAGGMTWIVSTIDLT